MTYLARLAPDGESLVEERLGRRRLAELFPDRLGLRNQNASESVLAELGLVRVEETPRPDAGPDDVVEAEPTVRDRDGVWRTTWTVTPPDAERIAAIKAGLEVEARQIVEDELAATADGRGPYTLLAELLADPTSHEPFRDRAATLQSRVATAITAIRNAPTLVAARQALAVLEQERTPPDTPEGGPR